MRLVRNQDGLGHPLRLVAIPAFVGYVIWNVAWLSRGMIPPSILLYFGGIPCPTTGGCRSMAALLQGDLLKSLAFNPFTVPYVLLAVASGVILAKQALRRQALLLPRWVESAWLASLVLGWIAKFVLGRSYW